MDIAEVIREMKCLLSLNELAPRTQHQSLLNKNLEKRGQALSFIIETLDAYPKDKEWVCSCGKLINPDNYNTIEGRKFCSYKCLYKFKTTHPKDTEELRKKLQGSHHMFCNFYNRRVGDCNCEAVMKEEYKRLRQRR